MHATGDLFGPGYNLSGRNAIVLFLKHVVQGTVRAELHHNAITWRLSANTFKLHNIRMIQFSQIANVGLLQFLHLFHGYIFVFVLAVENNTLSAAADQIQIRYLFKRNFPII